ncbi:MAG TPA: putative glycolipid-binding domain-containing protein [Cytophagaceae bacterium]
MQTNILWVGRQYYSLENCLVNIYPDRIEVSSTILGYYQNEIYKVDYRIVANLNWITMFIEIKWRLNEQIQEVRLESDGVGNWIKNGNNAEQLKGCIDVDISLSPFTNTLPIRRLHLKPGHTQEIAVVYCDFLNQQIKPVRQKYTRLSDKYYGYENVPNDFEAIIQVDESGIVVNYPSLFERVAIRHL